MTPRQTLERAAAKGLRVRVRMLAGEELVGVPFAIIRERICLFGEGHVPTRALWIRAITSCEVVA